MRYLRLALGSCFLLAQMMFCNGALFSDTITDDDPWYEVEAKKRKDKHRNIPPPPEAPPHIVAHPHNLSSARKCELSLCSMFRDEAEFLKEWIEYHRIVGVKHFYLYNNLSQDNYWEVLEPYIRRGIVELFDVTVESLDSPTPVKIHNKLQTDCYNHAIGLSQYQSKWLAIIDSDEFICPMRAADLPSVLRKYDYAGGLVVHWIMYGTSDVWELQPGQLMVEQLTHREVPGAGQFKSIVRPELAKSLDPHYCEVRNKPTVIETGKKFSHHLPERPMAIIRINHYHYRTGQFYENTKRKRRCQWGDCPNSALQKERINKANAVFDATMFRFVPELQHRMSSPTVID